MTVAAVRQQRAVNSQPDRPSAGDRILVLDGLRGLAVLLVMFSHFAIANPPTGHWFNLSVSRLLHSGWIGVDFFFVLSGFLITGILCDARDKAGYFRNFYMRRLLRIFPLYYAALIILTVLLPAVFPSQGGMEQMQTDSVWYWSYLANIKIALAGWPTPPEYLGHFWSLAVEEQFYLFWPLLVLVLSPRSMLRCCALLIVAALVLRMALHAAGEVTAANVLTLARLDTLAIGGLVALLARRPGGLPHLARWNVGVGLACGGIVIALYIFYRGLPAGTFPVGTVGYTTLAGMFASMMVAALVAPANSLVARLWSARPLVFLGKYSYALYVVHPAVIYFWPVALSASALQVITGRWIFGFLTASMLMLIVCVGVALVSWHGLEKHFLRLRFRYADGGAPVSREAFIPSSGQSATLPAQR